VLLWENGPFTLKKTVPDRIVRLDTSGIGNAMLLALLAQPPLLFDITISYDLWYAMSHFVWKSAGPYKCM
jgi:hypothetical protein